METRLQSLISEAREAETNARAFTRFVRTRTHTLTQLMSPSKRAGHAEADRKRPQHRTLTLIPLNLCTNKVSCTSINPRIPLIPLAVCALGAGGITYTPS